MAVLFSSFLSIRLLNRIEGRADWASGCRTGTGQGRANRPVAGVRRSGFVRCTGVRDCRPRTGRGGVLLHDVQLVPQNPQFQKTAFSEIRNFSQRWVAELAQKKHLWGKFRTADLRRRCGFDLPSLLFIALSYLCVAVSLC